MFATRLLTCGRIRPLTFPKPTRPLTCGCIRLLTFPKPTRPLTCGHIRPLTFPKPILPRYSSTSLTFKKFSPSKKVYLWVRLSISIVRRTAVIITSIIGVVFSVYQAGKMANSKKYELVLSTLEKGTSPTDNDSKFCSRQELLDELKELIMSDKCQKGMMKHFHVVVGPVGCGKSWLMRELARKNTKGCIYHQIYDSKSFPSQFGKECGMSTNMLGNMFQIASQTLLRLVGSQNSNFQSWFEFPDDEEAALSFVFSVLESQSKTFITRNGFIPTIIIDAVDILAKTNQELLKHLIRVSKRVVNDGVINVVLVSSEDRVVPLIKELAEQSRVNIVYVPDVKREEARKILTNGELADDIANKLVHLTGPRLQHLYWILLYAQKCGYSHTDPKLECIKKHLAERAKSHIKMSKATKSSESYKLKKAILLTILDKTTAEVSELEYALRSLQTNIVTVNGCIAELLEGNVLMLKDNELSFSSKLDQLYTKAYLSTDDEQPVEL